MCYVQLWSVYGVYILYAYWSSILLHVAHYYCSFKDEYINSVRGFITNVVFIIYK